MYINFRNLKVIISPKENSLTNVVQVSITCLRYRNLFIRASRSVSNLKSLSTCWSFVCLYRFMIDCSCIIAFEYERTHKSNNNALSLLLALFETKYGNQGLRPPIEYFFFVSLPW